MIKIEFIIVTVIVMLNIASSGCSLASSTNYESAPKLPNIDDIPAKHAALPDIILSLGGLKIKLEHTTLHEMLQTAEIGVIQSSGDASESEIAICFTYSSKVKHQRIWLSSSELNTGADLIDGVTISEISDGTSMLSDCPELPETLLPPSLSIPIWVGSSQDQLVKWLGVPTTKKQAWWFYNYENSPTSKGFVSTLLIAARLVHGKVNAVILSKSTSN